jgi:23S rRNA (uracil1939-C5)-methyltransferase
MSLATGQTVELTLEKPAGGGRMIARHDGQVVLVQGAIPGERVRARVERVEKHLAFATTTAVLEASPDRRTPAFDPLCGGAVYAHIQYSRQVTIKGEVIADAFQRLARIPTEPVAVRPSPEQGYRMRARLHVRDGRAGFYRESSHDLCDAAATGQLLPATMEAVRAVLDEARADGLDVTSIELSENIAADGRAMHLELASGEQALAGDDTVADPVSVLTAGRASTGELRRRAVSFFQANRFLLPALVTDVLDAVLPEGDVLDLYAGVGLFSVALAAIGRRGITAVEGDPVSGADLRANAAAFGGSVRSVIGAVEDHLSRRRGPAAPTIVVDPPRTGISRGAMSAIARHGAERIVYVSCDPATMARDARRLLDAGYRLESLRGFDLFPNTPHVETVGVFGR